MYDVLILIEQLSQRFVQVSHCIRHLQLDWSMKNVDIDVKDQLRNENVVEWFDNFYSILKKRREQLKELTLELYCKLFTKMLHYICRNN